MLSAKTASEFVLIIIGETLASYLGQNSNYISNGKNHSSPSFSQLDIYLSQSVEQNIQQRLINVQISKCQPGLFICRSGLKDVCFCFYIYGHTFTLTEIISSGVTQIFKMWRLTVKLWIQIWQHRYSLWSVPNQHINTLKGSSYDWIGSWTTLNPPTLSNPIKKWRKTKVFDLKFWIYEF